jgi:hypothetical protein
LVFLDPPICKNRQSDYHFFANHSLVKHHPTMFRLLIRLIIWLVRFLFKSEHDLRIENLALRQQLAVFKDKSTRLSLQNADRAFWVALRNAWPRWTNTLILVKPDTVAKWVVQQLREGFPFDTAPRYLILDRDGKYGEVVPRTLKSWGIKPVRTSYKSPWQNGVCERWVLSARIELLDHVVVLNEAHLHRLLSDYVRYYHEDRCHLSLEKDSPHGRPVTPRPSPTAKVVSLPRVGGIHHRYEWREAA